MNQILSFFLMVFLCLPNSYLFAKNKKDKIKKNRQNHQENNKSSSDEGSLDLSSEIQESVSDAKKTSKEVLSTKKIPTKKREKKVLRVTGEPESIQVPDSVEWEHHRKKEDKQIQNLQKQIEKEPNQPSMIGE